MIDPLHSLEDKAVILEPGRPAQPLAPELAEPKQADTRAEQGQGPVVAAMIFYRQTPERLERAIASLKGRCAGLVALDGPFVGLSDDLDSPEDNYNAIADAADAAGLEWDAYCGRPWAGEPQKRTAAARMALELHWRVWNDEKPWVLVLDSDEWLESDIDWATVLATGHGSAQMVSYRWPERAEHEGGDGSLMVRLVPNSEHLLWGPAHFDLRDMSVPKTYTGWEKALSNSDAPAFQLGHDLGEKVIQAEYEAYNDGLRLAAEGRMMRVVDDYSRGDRLVVRMDCETADANGWAPGVVVSFNAGLLGTAEGGYAEVVGLDKVDGIEAYDIRFERVPDDEAPAKIRANAEREIQRRIDMQQALARRVKKRSRSWRDGPSGPRRGGLMR